MCRKSRTLDPMFTNRTLFSSILNYIYIYIYIYTHIHIYIYVYIYIYIYMYRPWHDTWAIAHAHAIHPHKSKKGSLCRRWKAHPNISCVGWYCLPKIIYSLFRIYFNWYNRINFELILLTLLYKSLFLKKNLNCSFFCYILDILSIFMPLGPL